MDKGIKLQFVGNATLNVTVDLKEIDPLAAALEIEDLKEKYPAKSIITNFQNTKI